MNALNHLTLYFHVVLMFSESLVFCTEPTRARVFHLSLNCAVCAMASGGSGSKGLGGSGGSSGDKKLTALELGPLAAVFSHKLRDPRLYVHSHESFEAAATQYGWNVFTTGLLPKELVRLVSSYLLSYEHRFRSADRSPILSSADLPSSYDTRTFRHSNRG